jgi:hypothetical protein
MVLALEVVHFLREANKGRQISRCIVRMDIRRLFLSELNEFLIFSASSCCLHVAITVCRFCIALHETIF